MSAALKKPAAPVLKQRNGAMIGTPKTARSEQTIVTWLKSMGWTVEVNDMRDDEADDEEE